MEPRLLALATAVPPFVLDQRDVASCIETLYPRDDSVRRMLPVFRNAGIRRRYSCVPLDWYVQPHGWKERNDIYVHHAVTLFERLTLDLLDKTGLDRNDIDVVVTVSTTGLSTPSLDALLVERLGLRRDVRRLPIFGLGCAGGVIGLTRAAELAKAEPGSRVLFLVVELCALNFRRNEASKSNVVATALFGDGAAGAILSTAGDGPLLDGSGEFSWPDSLDVMGWAVEDDGLRALFAQSIPDIIRRDMRGIADDFLDKQGLSRDDIDFYACHPGGAKVLNALEEALELGQGALRESRETLSDFGNMSAATVLFVLERMGWREPHRRSLLMAMGPGFTAAFQLLGAR
jgi:alkylresorcinol/alkylpyrone synthase